jgi:hypothetical protein
MTRTELPISLLVAWLSVGAVSAQERAPFRIAFDRQELEAINAQASSGAPTALQYRRFAQLVFGNEATAQAQVDELTQQRLGKRIGFSEYWERRDAIEDPERVAPAWKALRQGLYAGNPDALRATEQVLREARDFGLGADPTYGGAFRREAQRLLERRQAPQLTPGKPYVPLRTTRRVGGETIDSARGPVGLDPEQLLGVADWWARQPNASRRLVNRILADRSPDAQRTLLKELAEPEISARIDESRDWGLPDEGWLERLPRPVQRLVKTKPRAVRDAIGQGFLRMRRDEQRNLDNQLIDMLFGDVSSSTIFRELFDATVPPYDSLGRKKRNELKLLTGTWNFQVFAQLNDRWVEALARREQGRAAREEDDEQRELIRRLQRIQSDAGRARRAHLPAHGEHSPLRRRQRPHRAPRHGRDSPAPRPPPGRTLRRERRPLRLRRTPRCRAPVREPRGRAGDRRRRAQPGAQREDAAIEVDLDRSRWFSPRPRSPSRRGPDSRSCRSLRRRC